MFDQGTIAVIFFGWVCLLKHDFFYRIQMCNKQNVLLFQVSMDQIENLKST